jgi:DNA polymerase elongation subunit (family B)
MENINVIDCEGYSVNGKHKLVCVILYDGNNFKILKNKKGLSSTRILNWLVSQNVTSYIFSGTYDTTMFLKDLPYDVLTELWQTSKVKYKNYEITLFYGKYFMLKSKKNCFRMFDLFSFYQTSFINAISKHLNVSSDVINEMKARRATFDDTQFEEIITYCKEELTYLYELVKNLFSLIRAIGLEPKSLFSPASLSKQTFRKNNIKEFYLSRPKGNFANALIRSYAGGRIEALQFGQFSNVINVDINSAYPFAMTKLVTLDERNYSYCVKDCDSFSDYDLIHIHFKLNDGIISPFFHRSSQQKICYPKEVDNWFYGNELINGIKFLKHYQYKFNVVIKDHFHYKGPFKYPLKTMINSLYKQRQLYKQQLDSKEFILKLVLNASYGTFAQHINAKSKSSWHKLEWASFITSFTRAQLLETLIQNNIDLDDVVSFQTDGIMIQDNKNYCIKSSENLGGLTVSSYNKVLLIKSGVYFINDNL